MNAKFYLDKRAKISIRRTDFRWRLEIVFSKDGMESGTDPGSDVTGYSLA